MMPPDDPRLDEIRQWLAKAEEDFAVASLLLHEHHPFYGIISFHAQQAAEKFLKALLVRRGIEFPKTHDLSQLLDLLPAVDAPLAAALHNVATILKAYTDKDSFPADLPDLTADEAANAVDLASTVRQSVLAAFP